MKRFQIREVKTEYQRRPMGLDEAAPRFSWKLHAEEQDFKQSAWRVRVGSGLGESDMWDSGRVESDCSGGVAYGGKPLEPTVRYYLTVTVWDEKGGSAENAEEWFETGLMNPTVEAWDGAVWMGAPEKYIRAETMGVFVISCKVKLESGSRRAGIVFGADDARLMDERMNQYGIAGENYIRYVLDVGTSPAMLHIYRAGYHPDDQKDIPFASVPVKAFGRDEEDDAQGLVITDENRYEEHELTVEVIGDNAFAYVDGILVDAVEQQIFGNTVTLARQLNPLGYNDVTTFPRLCKIGYYVGKGDSALFRNMEVSNYRAPGRVLATMDEGGVRLSGTDEEGKPAEKQMVRDPSAHSLPMFRRDFTVHRERGIESARLYITARGIYDCRINGKEVTDTWFNPGASQYTKHIMYQTYDVGELLQEGTNGIGIMLASGWWCDAQTFALSNYNYYGDKEAVLAKLVIRYADGRRDCYTTGTKDWDYYGEGPYLYAGFFQGEHLDGRKLDIYERFSLPGFAVDGMKKPVETVPDAVGPHSTMPAGFGRPWPGVDHSHTQIVGGINAPVAEVCRRYAKTMSEPRKGLYVYDMEQEMAGVPVIRLRGRKGTQVTIRYGEMLFPELPEYDGFHGMMLLENYRDAESIDKYILKGDPEGEVYSPRFTFHGYRYIEISGVEQPPALEDVGSIQLSSVTRITGKLETSNPLVNRLIENVKWSQLCNFISIPTDCPQRNERMGWAGDTHVFCRTATCQSDTRLFYYRYLQALEDLQEESGQLPNIAPVGGGFGGITYESAMIFIVWELYQQYGDTGVVQRFYPAMKKWADYIRGQGMPGDVFAGPLGDWLAPVETDNHLLWNAFYGYDMELMAKLAKVAGYAEDAAYFEGLRREAVRYWNETFVEPETGMTKGMDGKVNDTQCSYALPLAYHMFDEGNAKRAYGHLARKTKELDCTLQTGFFGTGVISRMLTEGGYTELAYGLLQQTKYPSWLYPVTQGATTVWERWDSFTLERGFGGNNNMNSFNHYSLGSVLSWIYECVLGIERDEEAPGYKHFVLQPRIGFLEYAKGGFETVYGRIESGWRREGRGYCYQCRIPENTTALVRLPGRGEMLLGSGSYTFELEEATKY